MLNTSRRFALLCLAVTVVFQLQSIPPTAAEDVSQYYARTWQADDGLPRSTITSIAQTDDGYLWLGTPFGVIRFDGVTFTPISELAGWNLGRLRARVLYADAGDRLWIGSGTDGIGRWSASHGSTVIKHDNGLPHPTINAMCEDQQMKLWIATGDGQVSWVDADDKVHPAGLVLGKPSAVSIQLLRDRTGTMWFAQGSAYGQLVDGVATNIMHADDPVVLCASRQGGLWFMSGTRLSRIGEHELTPGKDFVTLPGKPLVPLLFEDRQGNLWIGTANQGLYRYGNGRFIQEFDTLHRIMACFQDTENNLWVGTSGGGLVRLRPKVFSMVSPRKNSKNFPALSVCKDRDGGVWLTPQGPGLARWSEDGALQTFDAFLEIGTTAVLPAPDGGAWVGTVNQGLYHVDANGDQHVVELNGFKDRQIRVLHQDARGNLWLGCLPDGLAEISKGKTTILPSALFDQGLPRTAILSIADDHAGKLWLGTINGDLYAYDHNRFTRLDKAGGLPGEAISALHPSTNGDLWIGTLGGGLGRYRNGRLVFCGKQNGLADDVIATIVDGGDGYFWLGSEQGIFRVRQEDLNAVADGKQTRFESICYGRDDGLANVEMVGGYQPAAWKNRNGEIWFATSKGALRMNPGALSINTRPPPLMLEKILLDGVEVKDSGGLKFKFGFHKLEFQYTATSFVSPERVRFRRQLDGLDSTWVDAGPSRSAVYPQLSPGNYAFRFAACNSDGIWNEHPVSVAFTVIPAFWQTSWFRLLGLFVFTVLVAAAVRYRYKKKMQRKLFALQQAHALEQERMRIARDIHDDLGARLTQVAFLSEMSAKEADSNSKLAGLLGKITQGTRQSIRSLEEIVWAVNPRKDSLPHLVDYLSHYANEFFRDTDVRCRQDLPMMIPEIALSAEVRHHLFLACKEALNNIRKHANATEVWLRVAVTADEIRVMIEDNGAGFSTTSDQPHGNGLLNLQSRLAALGGRCEIHAQPGRGTHVFLTIKQPPAGGKSNSGTQTNT